MSLLIDALKKAEQEKKEAARRLKEAQEKSGESIGLEPSTVTREKLESAATEQQAEQADEFTPRDGLSISAEKKTPEDIELSPLEEYTIDRTSGLDSTAADPDTSGPRRALQSEITQEVPEPSSHPARHELRIAPLSGDTTFAIDNLTIEESSNSALDDADQPDANEPFPHTLSDSRDTPRPVVTAAQLVKDIGGGKAAPTPVAAQTVFTAVNTASGKRQILEWSMFLGLFALILSAGGALYYLKITPAAIKTSSPRVARGIESELQPPVIVPLPDIITETGIPASANEDTAADTGSIAAATSETPEVTTEIQAESSLSPDTPVPDMAMAGEPDTTTGPATGDADQLATQRESTPLPATLPEKIPVDEHAIAISRSRSVSKSDQLINQAYADYSTGNYAQAESTYLQVLENKSGNRDALLGLAAIAWRKGQMQQAYEYYLRVLKLFPRDTVATTALINIQSGVEPVRSESVLKLMIKEQPEAAFLHFALGNNYANQSRWADAQSSFFEAYRRDPASGDFAYNLAVSLDQLGQTRAALDYYQKALELADQKEPAYNTTAVLARVNTLLAQAAPSGP